MQILPVLPILIPLLAAAILAALNKLIPRRASSLIAMAVALGTAFACGLLVDASRSTTIVYWLGGWQPRQGIAIGIALAIDPMGAAFAGLTAILACAALLFSSEFFDTIGNLFHVLMLVFLSAMCGFALSGDLFNLFVFFELMSVAAFALCAYKTEQPEPVQAALNFAVTNTVAAYFVITGIALVYARTGALNLAQAGRALLAGRVDNLVLVAFTFMAGGYLVKAAIVPFHFWLADAHAVAPTPVCVLFSGVMVQMGLYGAARVYWTVFDGALGAHHDALRPLLVGAGVGTALIAAIMCYGQRNFKRMLAFSTASHVGLMLVGIGLFTADGLAGTAVYVLGHAAIKSSLFLSAGILLHRFCDVDEFALHGRGKRALWTAPIVALGAAGLAGMPPSGTSMGDSMIHEAARSLGYDWITWISLTAAVLTSGAVFRFTGRVFFGWGPAEESEPGEAPPTKEASETSGPRGRTAAVMFVPAATLAIAGVTLGFLPQFDVAARRAAVRFTDRPAYAARVLNDVPEPPKGNAPPAGMRAMHGLAAVSLAMLLAALDLFSKRFREAGAQLAVPMRALRRLQSGHVGDYVTWVAAGIGAFGSALLFLVR